MDELNPDNPLGMNGEIANAFGETINSLWAGSSGQSSFAPRRLKWKTKSIMLLSISIGFELR